MLDTEMNQYRGYEPYEHSETTNARNGRKAKTIHNKYGEFRRTEKRLLNHKL